jgi:hypothetical protein
VIQTWCVVRNVEIPHLLACCIFTVSRILLDSILSLNPI